MIVKQNDEKYRKFGVQYKDGYHVGIDLGSDVGQPVYSEVDGVCHPYTGQHLGYGSLNPSTLGGVCFIQTLKYIVQYGHVNLLVKSGDVIKKGQQIGTVTAFTNSGVNCSHVHVGLWNGLDLPPSRWGYVTDETQKCKWVDYFTVIK
jgi:murein DD-endopeptidase MepM/ murein hydrolase activator NlpD